MTDLIVLLIAVFLLMCCFVYWKHEGDKEFEAWFDELLKIAPEYGFTPEEIDRFEEMSFWEFYTLDMVPDEALEMYKKESEL